jgi:hypothetical protein
MSRKAPIAVESDDLTGHPGVRAWHELGGDGGTAAVELWREESLTKPAIYRLRFADPAHPAVFAKRCLKTSVALERRIYEEILPHLPLSTPRYFGFRQDEDGYGWLFIEDVGSERFSPIDPAQRGLAARWLGLLHRSGADLPAAGRLPDAGAARYLGHLRAAREKIRGSSGNPGLTSEHRATLNGILALLDALEARWHEFERACEGLPATLVHGDFRPKNVRVRNHGPVPGLYPIDWETAGWGVPAADLAPARGSGLGMQVDPHVYETVVRARWPSLDAAAIRKLSILGHVFRALAGIEWASESLVFESRDWLGKPVNLMPSYAARIAHAIEAAPEWLA